MIFLHDEQEGKTIAKAHREWIIQNGVDSQFGLPVSELDLMHKISAPPRGCDLSWRLALWKSFDPEIANVWYQIYHRNFWHDMGMISGFREWPKIEGGRPSDIDSGPILYGIGSTARVLGLMSAESFEDRKSRTALINQANLLIAARKDKSEGGQALTTLLDNELAARGIQVTADCKTGFLFGDVTLFYALSWKAPSL